VFLYYLEIIQYKNHQNQVFEFEHKFNVFIGKNGVGKTNILDAIYYLANFKSHITSLDSLNINHDSDFFRLYGKFKNDHEVLVKFAPRSKTIEINHVKVQKYSEVFGHVPLVLASPGDIFLLHDGSEERRKFIDYTISTYHKEYLLKLNQYHQYLDQRNAHLKQSEKPDLNLIKYYDQHLSELGSFIYRVRKEAIADLKKMIIHWYQTIAQNDDQLSIEYTSQLNQGGLEDLYRNTWTKDLALRRTTAGIHRDDLTIHMHDQDLKKIASQGQQKSLLYALRIAQAEFIAAKTNKKIIFLLDDFSDKLDENRRVQLLNLMQTLTFVDQWFITDTSSASFSLSSDSKIWEI